MVIHMETQRLSFSAKKQYDTCPEQYRLSRIVGLPDVPGWYNAGGTAVHEMTADNDLAEVGMPVEGHEQWTFNDYFDAAIAAEVESTGVPTSEWKSAGRVTKALPEGEAEKWWRSEGPAMVRRWNVWRDKMPFDLWITPDGEPAIELDFTMEHGDAVSTPGAIDRIFVYRTTGQLVVVDLKTGKPPKDNVQLATYGSAVEDRWGVECSYGGYWMAREGTLTGMHGLRPDMGARLSYDYSTVANKIRANLFGATPSGLCAKHCPVVEACYAGGRLKNLDHLPFEMGNDA